jgi:hypothetical protein
MATAGTHATIEELLGRCFQCGPCRDDEKGSLESETVKYAGLGPEINCAGEGQQQL